MRWYFDYVCMCDQIYFEGQKTMGALIGVDVIIGKMRCVS